MTDRPKVNSVTHYYNITFYFTVDLRHRDAKDGGGQRALKVGAFNRSQNSLIWNCPAEPNIY